MFAIQCGGIQEPADPDFWILNLCPIEDFDIQLLVSGNLRQQP